MPTELLSHYNITRGDSDHNVIGVKISCHDIKTSGHNIRKRQWKNFNNKRCSEKFRNTEWDDILEELDVNVANSMLEDRIRKIIETEAPMKTTQNRAKYNKWMTDNTKAEMLKRDMARDIAKITDK